MRTHVRRRRGARGAIALALATVLAVPSGLAAAPPAPRFGPLIEPYQPYVGQSKCAPKAKPGVRRFATLLLNTYGSTWIGISRPCSSGGRSEHKEGRALDWSMNANKAGDRAKVNDLFSWLFARDAKGNPHAMARRLGIMYIIWDRKIWSSWTGRWNVYCVQKNGKCRSPSTGNVLHAHRDHVHFSFSWPGARRRTSFFQPLRSKVTSIEADPVRGGYWLGGGNGSVNPFGAGFFGSKAGGVLAKPSVGLAARPSGSGYWLVLRNGRVFAFGDAPFRGEAARPKDPAVDIEPTPSGNGYWIARRSGRVDALGDAPALGGATGAAISAMGAIQSGKGYFLFSSSGQVYAFGDARPSGSLLGKTAGDPVVGGAVHPGGGYWLVTRNGRVRAFGSARAHGQPTVRPVAGIASTPSGMGYWVAGRFGRVQAFGDAKPLGSL